MTVEDIVNKRFSRSVLGYDIGEVDLFLDSVIEQLEAYERERKEMMTAMDYLLKELEQFDSVMEGVDEVNAKRGIHPYGKPEEDIPSRGKTPRPEEPDWLYETDMEDDEDACNGSVTETDPRGEAPTSETSTETSTETESRPLTTENGDVTPGETEITRPEQDGTEPATESADSEESSAETPREETAQAETAACDDTEEQCIDRLSNETDQQ